ncbi:hypothetical protein, partial [Aneurinibacillus aneurinilyticus]|uniref:hypothetical protein n=1 Tax=Aneurinibacillus aneurinilyticus TaxID=1391 RepID=UPI003D1C9BB1
KRWSMTKLTLYIPLRSNKTEDGTEFTCHLINFISHYVHIKLCFCMCISGTEQLYIPLRSDKTPF